MPLRATRSSLHSFFLAVPPRCAKIKAPLPSPCPPACRSLELLCHLADLARKGVLPGSDEQQVGLGHTW